MANPFPFVAGAVLTAAQLNGIGETATAYTPTLTNLTLGNGTMNAKYVRVNKLILGQISIVFGSTTVMGTAPTLSLPVTGANSLGGIQAQVYILDSGAAFFVGAGTVGTTTVNPFVLGVGGTYATNGSGLTATIPMTWTTNDTLYVTFQYEAA